MGVDCAVLIRESGKERYGGVDMGVFYGMCIRNVLNSFFDLCLHGY